MKPRGILEDIVNLHEKRKGKTGLIHAISNAVSMNDVAQAVIYAGGKPVMAHYEGEVSYITSFASALVVNLGTIDEQRINGITRAAGTASKKGIPIILDPVGIQVSPVRMELARRLLEGNNISVVKGNYSEVKSLIGLESSFIGIDSIDGEINDETLDKLKEYALSQGLIIILTGESDYIICGERMLRISNGTPLLSKITGSGCILSSVLGTLCGMAVKDEEFFYLCVCGLLMVSIAGEKAEKRLIKEKQGLYIFKNYFMDELSLISKNDILERGMVSFV